VQDAEMTDPKYKQDAFVDSLAGMQQRRAGRAGAPAGSAAG
jgi:hypothetical protein